MNPDTMPKSPFTPLHPTLKACHCGYIGPRSLFYKHIEEARKIVWSQHIIEVGRANMEKKFFELHGEIPLRADDPRVQ